jgi:hypothetical protein
MQTLFIQGRWVTAEQLDWIRQLITQHPQWGRFRLSLHIAEQWNWRNGTGRLKDMAARTLLLKLERGGLLELPRRQRGGGSRPAQRPQLDQPLLLSEPLLQVELQQLRPVNLLLVNSVQERQLLARLLSQHHYLGYTRPVGENLQYLAQDRSGRPLACLVFGAPAWKCAPRDQFIGWKGCLRQTNLHLLANNMRFLILPWVQVKHLASHVLGLASRRLSADWQIKYGHPIYLLESFVQPDRFTGSCYRAANWICVGQTQSRSRNDSQRCLQVPCKDVYLYPLLHDFQTRLQTQLPLSPWLATTLCPPAEPSAALAHPLKLKL